MGLGKTIFVTPRVSYEVTVINVLQIVYVNRSRPEAVGGTMSVEVGRRRLRLPSDDHMPSDSCNVHDELSVSGLNMSF